MPTVEQNELVAVAEDNGLEKTKVEILLSSFGQSYADARKLASGATSIIVTDEDQTTLMREARTKRLALKNIRVEVENTRKSLKEQSLREGKAIDGMSNIIKALIVPVEEHLEKQEKFAEVRQAERAAEKYASRVKRLSRYVADVGLYSLRDMPDETFEALITDSMEALRMQEEEEAAATLKRIEEAEERAEEQKRIRKENDRLKAEKIETDRLRKIEDEKREAALKIEREAAEKKAAAERAEAEKKLKAEREAREKLEREAKEREAAEDKRKADEAQRKAIEDEQKRQSLLAPDKQKLTAFADVIDRLELPNVANREAGKVLDETKDFLNRISKNLRNKAKEL